MIGLPLSFKDLKITLSVLKKIYFLQIMES